MLAGRESCLISGYMYPDTCIPTLLNLVGTAVYTRVPRIPRGMHRVSHRSSMHSYDILECDRVCVYTVLECVCVQCSSVCVQYPYSTRVCVCTHNCVYTRSLHQAIRYVTSTVTIRMCLQLCVHTCTNYMYYVLALALMHHACVARHPIRIQL